MPRRRISSAGNRLIGLLAQSLVMICIAATLAALILTWRTGHLPSSRTDFALPHDTIAAGQTSATPAAAIFWQVGISAGSDAFGATAMRTSLRVVQPHHIAARTTDFFWIGSYLADGSFIQAGYEVPWNAPTPHWFFCAFNSDGTEGPCKVGPPGSGGAAGTVHTFSLAVKPADQAGQWDWVATMDSRAIGDMLRSAGSTGLEAPAVYIEQSAFVATPPVNDLGPVTFAPALEISKASEDAAPEYVAPQHAFATESSSAACPAYGVREMRVNDVEIGSGLPCLPTGQVLW